MVEHDFGQLASKFPDVAGGHVDGSWFAEKACVRKTATGKQDLKWSHEQEGVKIFLPSRKQLFDMHTEFYQRAEGQPLGPVTQGFVDDLFLWAKKLKHNCFGASKPVTGLWQRAYSRWQARLNRLKSRTLAAKLDKEVKFGVRLPFEMRPAKPLRARHNHACLGERPDAVFRALCMQIAEGSLEGFDVRGGKRPKGIYSLRWVEKTNSEEVRLTLNGRPINPFFPKKETTIELETHTQLRTRFVQGQMYVGFDLHNGFFNQQYVAEDRTWVSFKITKQELGPKNFRRLRKLLPTSWVGETCYLSYRGLVMGLSPSCQQLQRVMDALLEIWRDCKVIGVRWDGSAYIDDLMAMASGSFKGALVLAIRLLTEFVLLGFSVNLNYKTIVIPTRFYCHIGVCISSTKMRFSLPERRAIKMRACAKLLRKYAKVGGRVSAKLVAKFVGLLWSASVVCYRAVAIMARAMVRTLAVMIGESEAAGESDLDKLKYILKRVWGGHVIWTAEAEAELRFWLAVDFRCLSAPITHDVHSAKASAWVISPKSGKTASDVRVFAVDTSESMSGGGEFIREGELWVMRGKMAVRLTPEEAEESSTMRELLGVLRLDLSLAPSSASKIILPLDSQAAVWCLLRGSKVPCLQRVVRAIFLNQLRHRRILWPVWMRRSMDIIMQCDAVSRLVDNHAYAMDPRVFWQANAVAVALWGRGFQVDVCADLHNVQPVDRNVRLPFFSRWVSPMSMGTDMFQQLWVGRVVWCNPPFALLPRVFALMRAQKACGAVVVPLGSRRPWRQLVRLGAPGVLRRFVFDPSAAAGRLGSASSSSSECASREPYRDAYAVVFVDYSAAPPSTNFYDEPSAESLGLGVEGSVDYLCFGGRVRNVAV